MRSGRSELAYDWESPPTHRAISEFERQAYERHARDLETGADRGLWFDDAAALRAITIIETCCRHWKGEWSGRLVVLENWERFIVRKRQACFMDSFGSGALLKMTHIFSAGKNSLKMK